MTFKRIQALQIKSWLHLLLYESLRQFSIMLTQIMITGATLTSRAISVNRNIHNGKGFDSDSGD